MPRAVVVKHNKTAQIKYEKHEKLIHAFIDWNGVDVFCVAQLKYATEHWKYQAKTKEKKNIIFYRHIQQFEYKSFYV